MGSEMCIRDRVNPATFDCSPKSARFFIIKSYSEDDIHMSIKHGIWASTDTGNRRLDAAYRESASRGPIYLFFSVNASGQFSGMAQMESGIDYTKKIGALAQDKWSGTFAIKWIFVKDLPNSQFRHILLANNENKPVTNSRDTQELLLDPGCEMLNIFHTFQARTSVLDDFGFYEKRHELMEARATMQAGFSGSMVAPMGASVGGAMLGTLGGGATRVMAAGAMGGVANQGAGLMAPMSEMRCAGMGAGSMGVPMAGMAGQVGGMPSYPPMQ